MVNHTNMIQTKLRIPTKHTYAFVEMDLEVENEQGIKDAYNSLYELMNAKEETNEKDYLLWLSSIIDSNFESWGDINLYHQLSDQRKAVIQSMKRYKKRIVSTM